MYTNNIFHLKKSIHSDLTSLDVFWIHNKYIRRGGRKSRIWCGKIRQLFIQILSIHDLSHFLWSKWSILWMIHLIFDLTLKSLSVTNETGRMRIEAVISKWRGPKIRPWSIDPQVTFDYLFCYIVPRSPQRPFANRHCSS